MKKEKKFDFRGTEPCELGSIMTRSHVAGPEGTGMPWDE